MNDPNVGAHPDVTDGVYQKATSLQPTLEADYADIAQRAPNAHVIVIGYPQIFPPAVGGNCGQSLGIIWQMSQDSLNAIRDTWAHLNNVIQAAAATARVSYMDDSQQWTGHDFCTGNAAYANGLRGELWRNDPDNESFHPNVAGYRQLASDLNTFITSNWP